MDIRHTTLGMLLTYVVLAGSGCSIGLRPEWTKPPRAAREPLVRLDTVEERLTGTWVAEAKAAGWGHKQPLLHALRQGEAASYFSNDPASMPLRIRLVSDHESDTPRLVLLGCMSMISLGIIPLNYYSVWNVDCEATVHSADGTSVGSYPVHTKGSYNIWAFPPTMFTLFAASARGQRDGSQIAQRVGADLATRICQAIADDYPRLAKWHEASKLLRDQRPLAVQAGGTTLWVLYAIGAATPADATKGAARRAYLLKLYTAPPARGATPHRTLVIGERAATTRPDAPWQWRDPASVVFYADRRLWHPRWKTQGAHHHLVAVQLVERAVAADELFRPHFYGQLPPADLNAYLISWKNRELEGVLREARTRELREHVDRIEHMALKANEAAEKEKDEGQRLAQQGRPGAERHAQAARTYRSRIEILKPILAAMKAELANRQR